MLDLSKQSNLFEETEEYFYHGYITNIYDKSIEEIIRLIDSRGHQENFIKDFKRGLGTVHIPTKHFFGNYAYFLVSMLSWNLKYWLLYIIDSELQIHWKRFRYIFIKVGAQIVKSGKYVIVRFGKNFGRVDEFVAWHNKLCQAVIEWLRLKKLYWIMGSVCPNSDISSSLLKNVVIKMTIAGKNE